VLYSKAMRIGIVTPAPPYSHYGNRITALRWGGILTKLGHRTSIVQKYEGQSYDLLIALHARRSSSSIRRFHRDHPQLPLVLALTGTDLYRDIRHHIGAKRALEVADRVIVLQPNALRELPSEFRSKTRVIYQSIESKKAKESPRTASAELSSQRLSANKDFTVCVIGHLRPVKDPFRAALAVRLLPHDSKILLVHVGRAMMENMATKARAEMKINSRYRWLGERSHSRAQQILAGCRLCVLSSRIEGGANVLSEAILAAVPVLASRIEGNVGILGSNYPGLFNVGDTKGLARLLSRAETDRTYLNDLIARVRKLARLFRRAREEQAWAQLLSELLKPQP